MSQKTALKNRPDPRKPKDTPKASVLPVVDETPVEELTGSEKFIQSMAPHATTIALVAVAFVLGVIAWGVYQSTGYQGQASKWQEYGLSQFIDRRTGNTQQSDLVAESYPENEVGIMSALMSGDMNLKNGLSQLGSDTDKGLLDIKKAKASFQSVIDADDSLKTTLISQRAQYCLAYAEESLGELGKAKTLYKEFVDAAPDAPLADSARRGIERCSDDRYAALYNDFANYSEKTMGDAPGPSIPEKLTPGSFPSIDIPEGVVPPKGDETDTRMNADVEAEKAAAEKAAADKAAADKAAAEKAAADKAAADKAAAEKAAADKAAAEKAAADKAAADKAAADKVAADKAAAEKAAAEKAAADKAAADKAAAEKAAAELEAAEKAADAAKAKLEAAKAKAKDTAEKAEAAADDKGE